MHDLFIFLKGIALVLIVWFTDLVIIQFASFAFISSGVREFLIESKEIISLITSVLVLIHIIIKIRKDRGVEK
jgi:hypothetical protein